MPENANNNSRRGFITKVAKGVVGASLLPNIITAADRKRNLESLSRVNEKYSANDQIQIALIGAGGMGTADTNTAITVPGAKLIAACDLYDGRLADAKKKWGNDIFTTRDYREILERKDVDAVIIATPDFWHKDISVAAMNKGKSVYCEKPMVHDISEGPAVVEAQQKNSKVVYQVGSQGMSSLGNEKARQLLKDGAIGKLNYAEGFWARMSPFGAWQYPIPADASTKTVDWTTYLKNAPKRDFDPLRFFRWRNYRDYGTGVSGDLFVHLFSSLHFVTGSIGPEKVMATGGLRYWKDGREVPDVMLGMFDYPETEVHPAFNLSLRVNFVDGTGGTNYLRMVGSEGSMTVEWDKVTLYRNKTYAATDDPLLQGKKDVDHGKQYVYDRKEMLPPDKLEYVAEEGYKGAHFDHFYNLFNAMRTGGKVSEDALFGYRAAAPALLCNDSYFNNRIIQWDPKALKSINK
ncbi:Gfo/Idh/MocA family protein [Chitinophaga pinensis]|uniref:Oxidoreductase domain protein n=1 Tax=Chitinophaga pinensis (strain ATCC 43595 / DSM 2588 / LMG 13176 / NBRC 15968 / NCIMB 11800 / UQM 2034) TaxID=485918 RepID=A0A979G0K8_CHIPD|nr:Gfo/Idh/MocA family oxidoreductase [Chitinophaga pinensis]ACU58557.1 oxidoreductase domain protein [Chitinophaga pinensis DSM 2588]